MSVYVPGTVPECFTRINSFAIELQSPTANPISQMNKLRQVSAPQWHVPHFHSVADIIICVCACVVPTPRLFEATSLAICLSDALGYNE